MKNNTSTSNCNLVVYCSPECCEQSKVYHKYLCSKNNSSGDNNKEEKEKDEVTEKKEEGEEEKEKESEEKEKEKKTLDESAIAFNEYSKEKNVMYPLMIAEFLSVMVSEETERIKQSAAGQGKDDGETFTSWDLIDKIRYIELQPNETVLKEMELLKVLLDPKVQGISEFLSDQIYLMLKGKLLYNAYAVQIDSGDHLENKPLSDEHTRVSSSNDSEEKEEKKSSVGAALYKLATYIGQSEKDTNTKIIFQDNNHVLSVIATHPIKKGDEIKTSYTLPVPVPETIKQAEPDNIKNETIEIEI
ncbi:hypothetical protein BJ944DRAFT_244423 [Cunninghamella echinulata]|nr:hypothetical protein BJ944DRAFT_244423 [Cunninghamella echinulata]